MRAAQSKSRSIKDVEQLGPGRQGEGIEPPHKQLLELGNRRHATPPQRVVLLSVLAIAKRRSPSVIWSRATCVR